MKQSKHWAQLEERSTLWGMRILLRIYLLFGRTVLQVFLYPVVIYYWLINRSGRRASQSYLSRVAKFTPASKLNGSSLCSYKHFISLPMRLSINWPPGPERYRLLMWNIRDAIKCWPRQKRPWCCSVRFASGQS